MGDILFAAVFIPFIFKNLGHISKIFYRIVSVDVVVFEILHDHDDKKIKHDILLKQYEQYKDYYICVYGKLFLQFPQLVSVQPSSSDLVVSNIILYHCSPVEHLSSVKKLCIKF